MTQTINDQSAPVSQRSVKARLHSNTLTSPLNRADGGAGVRITDETELAALLADLTSPKSGVYRHFAAKQLGGGNRQEAELRTALDGACARVLDRDWGFPTSGTDVEAALAGELDQSVPEYLVTMEEVNDEVDRYFKKLLLADPAEGDTALKNPTRRGSPEMEAAGAAWLKVQGIQVTLLSQLAEEISAGRPGLSRWFVANKCHEEMKRGKKTNNREDGGEIGKYQKCSRCCGKRTSDVGCPKCRPGTQLWCDSCNGNGKMKCEPCNGKGRVAVRWGSGNSPGDHDDDEAPDFLDNLPNADDTATSATNAIEGRERIEVMRAVYADAFNAFEEMSQNNPNRQDIQKKVNVLIAVLAREADGMFDREDNAAGDNVRGAGGLSEELTAIVYDEIANQFPDFNPATDAGRRKANNYCTTYAQYTGRANPDGTKPENPEPEEAGVTNDV